MHIIINRIIFPKNLGQCNSQLTPKAAFVINHKVEWAWLIDFYGIIKK